jgi:hypothetical protein
MPHRVSMFLGVSWWRADRWVKASHALESLHRIANALAAGSLSIDKVVELTRFVTPQTEERLIRLARAFPRRRSDAEPTSSQAGGRGCGGGGTGPLPRVVVGRRGGVSA